MKNQKLHMSYVKLTGNLEASTTSINNPTKACKHVFGASNIYRNHASDDLHLDDTFHPNEKFSIGSKNVISFQKNITSILEKYGLTLQRSLRRLRQC